MLMYDYKRGMPRCLFIDIDDPNFTCNDCDLKDGVCLKTFYKKYGILRRN